MAIVAETGKLNFYYTKRDLSELHRWDRFDIPDIQEETD
jgi:hypothetical protein